MLAFTAARILTRRRTLERPLLLVEDGRVVEISFFVGQLPPRTSLLDLGDASIAPGYVDIHIHGSAGYDVMDEAPESLPAIERLLAQHGVTTYFPTTVSAPIDDTLRALDRLAHAIEQRQSASLPRRQASPLGIHLEGPFISHARRGVHPAESLLPPRLETFERFWQAARGCIRIMTIAPELEGAPELIAAAAARGVCVSLGHSDADWAAAEKGVAAGASHSTHTFNAMRPLSHNMSDHRDPGIVAAVLTDARLTADIIADGVHLDPSIVKLVALAKGPEQTVLISDAISATGMPDGRYRLGSIEVDVRDGRCTSEGRLAGSVLTLDRAVRNLAQFAEWELPLAIAAASENPARVVRCTNKGVLSPGADADFVVLDHAGNVQRTFVGGVECSA